VLGRIFNVLLKDPIIHLLRNAIDHGIENNETRKKLNKPSGLKGDNVFPTLVRLSPIFKNLFRKPD